MALHEALDARGIGLGDQVRRVSESLQEPGEGLQLSGVEDVEDGVIEDLQEKGKEALYNAPAILGQGDALCPPVVGVRQTGDNTAGLSSVQEPGCPTGIDQEVPTDVDSTELIVRGQRQSDEQVNDGRWQAHFGDSVPVDRTSKGRLGLEQQARRA